VDSWTVDDLDMIVETHGPKASQILSTLSRRLAGVMSADASISLPEGMPPSLQVMRGGLLLTVEVTTATGDAAPAVQTPYYWRVELPALIVSHWRREPDGCYTAIGRSAERLSVTEPCVLDIPLRVLLDGSAQTLSSQSGRTNRTAGD
jgi:hypothetical protein